MDNEYQYTTVSSDNSSGRQRLVFILHGSSSNSSNNHNHDQNSSRGVSTESAHSQIPISEVTDQHLSGVSATKITMRKTVSTNNNVVTNKQDTISGAHTKLVRRYIHRVVQRYPRTNQQQQQQPHQHQQLQLRQQQQQQSQLQQQQRFDNRDDEEDYSDDGYNSLEFDLELLKLVKKNLRIFVEDASTRKLRNGECKWSELRPSVRNFYFPRFKKYLLDREIHAPNAMIFKSIRDLHISRRDAWLKNIRRSRE